MPSIPSYGPAVASGVTFLLPQIHSSKLPHVQIVRGTFSWFLFACNCLYFVPFPWIFKLDGHLLSAFWRHHFFLSSSHGCYWKVGSLHNYLWRQSIFSDSFSSLLLVFGVLHFYSVVTRCRFLFLFFFFVLILFAIQWVSYICGWLSFIRSGILSALQTQFLTLFYLSSFSRTPISNMFTFSLCSAWFFSYFPGSTSFLISFALSSVH